jgi:hypothetical protein
MQHFRWVAIVTYRAEAGPIDVDHHLEELEELRDLIERGRTGTRLRRVVVRLNPKRVIYPGDTIEAPERR